MHLLYYNNGKIDLKKDVTNVPDYAILSHTWGDDAHEVRFDDMVQDGQVRARSKKGFAKIQFCVERAKQDGLAYSWIDTCCIQKANSTELGEAINSMFKWYENAKRCYVYLSDVSVSSKDIGLPGRVWENAFRRSRWFTRGWTLQELVAPASVRFFTEEGRYLGDKDALRQPIHEVTKIPYEALANHDLSSFTIAERFSWTKSRDTKKEEDMAYCLFGIFGVFMPLIYGEGRDNAMRRLREEIRKSTPFPDPRDTECLHDLRQTDPCDDKTRIQDTKGGLLYDSYRWILDNAEFQQWRDNPDSRLLWIRGDPGKGKTMLMCGVVDELQKHMRQGARVVCLSYFFCQATEAQLSQATDVLRGLIYVLAKQMPSLVSHIRHKYDGVGKRVFEDGNSWEALSKIFTDMLRDDRLTGAILLVDALDECTADQSKLLALISQPSRAKWIVSSRNWHSIVDLLAGAQQQVQLRLELNDDSISTAVQAYIRHKVGDLAAKKSYDEETEKAVRQHLEANAEGTFLWVALVCQALADPKIRKHHARKTAKSFPRGLSALYHRMIEAIEDSEDAVVCRNLLAIASTVYRPITVDELRVLSPLLDDLGPRDLEEVIQSCGSFLILRRDVLYFVHQSAKDYLVDEASVQIFPLVISNQHHAIFSQSLQGMHNILRRDMYRLAHPGVSIQEISKPGLDPLVSVSYSCAYWIGHLCDSVAGTNTSEEDFGDNGTVHTFLQEKFLYWLESLSLLGRMSEGVLAINRLDSPAYKKGEKLADLVHDAHRFILSHKFAIENAPLQTYASALLFSPTRSKVRELFKEEEPGWIRTKPGVAEEWDACTQTLEGHSNSVRSVVFSPDGKQLASGSGDKTVKVWDVASGACTHTLEGHSNSVTSAVFSQSGKYPDEIQQKPRFDLSNDKCWVTRNGENLLWLPPALRPAWRPGTFAVWGQWLGIGCKSGTVFVIRFQ